MRKMSFTSLGLKPYQEIWNYQKQWLNDALQIKKEGKTVTPEVLFVEHPNVYTLGKSADTANLLINNQFLKSIKAESIQIDRGGDITYHGPGQLVVYPLLDLEQFKMGVKSYIYYLEQIIIDILSDYNIEGSRVEGKTGIWLDLNGPAERKIAAIGIKCSRYLTIHGLAFNLNTDLSYFEHIIPCGIKDKGVTSLSVELKKPIDIDTIINQFKKHFNIYFKI